MLKTNSDAGSLHHALFIVHCFACSALSANRTTEPKLDHTKLTLPVQIYPYIHCSYANGLLMLLEMLADPTCRAQTETGRETAHTSEATTETPNPHHTSAMLSAMSDAANAGPGPGGDSKLCPHRVGRIVGPYFLTVYNLVTTIILMNVLGAMFLYALLWTRFAEPIVRMLTCSLLTCPLFTHAYSYSKTYEDVADESDKYWNLQRYELIEEYADTPPAAPPLLLLWDLSILLRALTRLLHMNLRCFSFLDLSGALRSFVKSGIGKKTFAQSSHKSYINFALAVHFK